jgi:hypothetical protein
MLTPILIAIVAVIVLFLVVVAMRPSEFRVSRAATISGPAEAAFMQVNDLHKWEAWSPWAKMDPTAKTTYDGPPSGVGAGFAWAGNAKIGEGRMTITESRATELVRFRLEFLKPFKGTNTAEFTFKPQGGKTLVTWSMEGKNNFISKAFGLFVNCDKMIGSQFEKGLADMNSIVAGESKKQSVAA